MRNAFIRLRHTLNTIPNLAAFGNEIVIRIDDHNSGDLLIKLQICHVLNSYLAAPIWTRRLEDIPQPLDEYAWHAGPLCTALSHTSRPAKRGSLRRLRSRESRHQGSLLFRHRRRFSQSLVSHLSQRPGSLRSSDISPRVPRALISVSPRQSSRIVPEVGLYIKHRRGCGRTRADGHR